MSSINDTNTNQQSNTLFTKRIWLAGGIIAFIIIFLLLFKTLFSLILLVLASVLLAVYFHGFAHLLTKIKIPEKISVFVAVLFNVLLIAVFFWFVGARLSSQVTQLSDTLPATIDNAQQKISSLPLGDKLIQYLQSSGTSQKTMAIAKQFFSSGFGIVSDLYIIILMSLFFTASPSVYTKGVVALMPSQQAKDKCGELLQELNTVLKKWLKGQIIGIVFIAALSAGGLLILGLPLVFSLSLIAGLLNFIPNFGPIIALIPAVLIAFTQSGSKALIVIGIYTGIQIIQSAVQQPLVQKKMVNIPPALTIIGQVAMGALGGFWGILLATPIVAIVMTIVDKLYLKKSMG